MKYNNLFLSQKRFLYEGSSSNEWYVPVSYTLSNDTTQFANLSPKIWLMPHHIHILPKILETNTWIIVNNQESGKYG